MTSTRSFELTSLAVDGEVDALGTTDRSLRFTWSLERAARGGEPGASAQSWFSLRVQVGHRSVWESGTVLLSTPWMISPPDVVFSAWTEHRWELRVGIADETLTAEGHFTPAPLAESDWHGAGWIGPSIAGHDGGLLPSQSARARSADGSLAAPILEHSVTSYSGVRRALLAVAAGGFVDVQVDGEIVGDEVLSPGTTHWDRRVHVVVHDLTAVLADGRSHTLGLELGRGFYGITNASVWHWEQAPWHASPRARAVLRIEHVDGEVSILTTGSGWVRRTGSRLLDDLYGGEIIDLRLDQRTPRDGTDQYASPGGSEPATVVSGPTGRLVARSSQPESVRETMSPARISRVKDGTWVVSFPRVIAGWVRLALPAGHPGQRIVVRYGERLLASGLPNFQDEKNYFEDGFQTDEIVLGETAVGWEPRFSYKGFAHVSIEGWPTPQGPSPSDVTACVVHTGAARQSELVLDQPLLQWTHDTTLHTMENNLHGYPTDTPKYEKNGWSGDAAVGADMFLTNLDTGRVLTEYVDALAETAPVDGPPDLVAPNAGVFGVGARAPVWHSALVTIPWDVYRHTGDHRSMAEHIETLERYARFELDRSPGGIADTILGDWVAPGTDPGGGNPPEDTRVPATAFLVKILDTVARIDEVLGRDSHWARENAARVREAFCREFLDLGGTDGIVTGPGDEGFRQSHHVLALAFDLVENVGTRQAIADALARDVHRRGDHLDTGAIGTKWLLPVLTDHGHAETAWAIALQDTVPSWGAWRDAGATSMLEHWNLAARSHGHYFLGTVDDWITGYVAGMRPLAPGWEQFTVAPTYTDRIESASFTLRSPYGRAAVRWRADGEELRTEITVPVGARAQVVLPGHERQELRAGEYVMVSQR